MPRALMTTCLALAVGATVAASAAAQPAVSAGVPVAEMPAAWLPAVARAEAAMNALQAALLAKLKAEMGRAGPAGGLRVCHDEASAVAAEVAATQGITLGRTSHALRNPANRPPGWAASVVLGSPARKASAETLRVFDLGEKLGVLRPIGLAEACATCHGAPQALPADVRAALADLYPTDRATGFATGDLRGWMWAEVPLAAR